MSVLVYTESWGGSFRKSTFEAVSYASETAKALGTEVVAVSLENVSDEELNKLSNIINLDYHIDLNWDGEYLPWFYVDVEATEVDNEYKYNNNSVVEATFDSNTSWIIGSDLIIQQPIYNPFFGNYTSSWEPIPTEFVDVELPQYAGTELNIAQGTKLYFSKKNGKLKTRRVLGPFPPAMKGDTITLYMKVYWEAGPLSFTKDDFSQKFIVE